MSVEVSSEKRGAEAKQDAFDQATEQATQKLTEELLGPEKAARYWPQLKSKILKNSTRYVLFIKGSAPLETASGSKVTVLMRLSPDNLESLLREEGVLNSATLRVLPLVEIADSRGARYAWWADMATDGTKPGPLEELFKRFSSQMTAKFKGKNAFIMDATNASFRMSVPAAYRTASLRREDQILLAQYLKADVVLSGKVESTRPRSENSELKLSYDLQMWQAKTGRAISEVQRSEPLSAEAPKVVQGLLDQTGPKVLDELAGKLAEAITAGNLNLTLVRVAVTGSMSYRQQTEFKRQLGQVREIKVLKERLFEPGRVIFEAESSVGGQELAKAVQRSRFSLYTVEVDGAQDDSLALTVKALSSASAQ